MHSRKIAHLQLRYKWYRTSGSTWRSPGKEKSFSGWEKTHRKHNVKIMLENLNAPNRTKFSISERTTSGLVTTWSLVPIPRIKTSGAVRATTWRSDDQSFATVHPPTPWKRTDTVPQRLKLPSARGSKLDLKTRLRRLTNEWPKIRTDRTPLDDGSTKVSWDR